MGSSERNYGLTNVLLVVSGALMFLFNVSAIAWFAGPYHYWNGWISAEYINLKIPFVVMEAVASMGGIIVIVSAYIWNEEHNRIFASIVSVLAALSICSGVLHAITIYYSGHGYGILLVFSGLLVLLGGAAKYDKYTKILALGTHMLVSDEQGRFEETQVQSEIRETEEKAGELIHDESTTYCVRCAARLPIDAAFCIECGASQETD
ncbi:MAG: hypothetical protein ACFE7I_07415 [Candidatus Hodarchaeota archaeon]